MILGHLGGEGLNLMLGESVSRMASLDLFTAAAAAAVAACVDAAQVCRMERSSHLIRSRSLYRSQRSNGSR